MIGEEPMASQRTAHPEVMSKRPAEVAGTGASRVSEYMISYRPFAGMEKWLAYRFSAWSEAKAWFVMFLVALFFYVGGPGRLVMWVAQWLASCVGQSAPGSAAALAVASQAVLYYFFAACGLVVAAIAGSYYAQPTHLGISQQGIRRYWNRKHLKLAGPLLPWERVRHMQLLKPEGKTSPQEWWVSFNSASGSQMKFRLGAIPSIEERADLLDAIDRFAPATTRDPELLEALTPPQDHSYTELWLKALSAPPKRERLTPLIAGMTLKDGSYTVVGQLGVGGQGTAYLARNHGNHHELKLLNASPSAAAGNSGAEGSCCVSPAEDDREIVLKESILPVYVDVNVRREALERFQKEALMLSSLDHPQVVKLKDYFVEDHRSYLVLEHIDGMSLRQLVGSRGALPEEQVRELAGQMCSILSYLHALVPPVVHRDFTPDNLILTSCGTLKLVDFNVAQQTEFTTTGTVVGKHAYIPPEQFRGKPTTQSDIYAMGATLFYLLTAEDPEPISQSHPILKRDDISVEMEQIVARATAIDTGKRYGEVGQLSDDLKARE